MAKQTFTTGQVLTAAQMTSLQQTAMLGGAASAKTASYTLVAADAGTAITMSNASATAITVNTGLFAAGDTIQITNLGAGVCTITAGTATVNTSASLALAQYESGTLTFTSTSAAIFIKGAGSAATSGGMTLISETVASASTGISFTSLGSYKQLLLIYSGIRHSATGSEFGIRFNNNSNTVYYSQGFNATGSNGATVNISGNNPTHLGSGSPTAMFAFGKNTSNASLATDATGFITIDNYTSSTKVKTVNVLFQYYDNTAGAYATKNSASVFDSTTAITSIDIVRISGTDTFSNSTNSTIRLYGVA